MDVTTETKDQIQLELSWGSLSSRRRSAFWLGVNLSRPVYGLILSQQILTSSSYGQN